MLEKIQSGDELLREWFINGHKPFLFKVLSRYTGLNVNLESTDEYSISLIAFNQAIDQYQIGVNHHFFYFAEQAIKWRLQNLRRDNSKHHETLPFSYLENKYGNNFEEAYLITDSKIQFDDIESKEEILALEKMLKQFGIHMEDLPSYTPKHKDSRNLCLEIANIIVENSELYSKLMKNKNIPRTELLQKINVHYRTIENHRKYIIALCITLKSNLGITEGYLMPCMKGGK